MPPSRLTALPNRRPEKVDDHLTAGAVMADDDQWVVRRQVIDARRDLRHRNVQGAVEPADIEFSRLSHVENDVFPPRGPHDRKVLNRG